MAKSNVWKVPHGEVWADEREGARHASAIFATESVAIRHHLDALILKLAAAQAGSLAAVRASRRHAEAALAILDGSDEVMCEHARVFGVARTADEWQCHGCGANWPASTAAFGPATVRTQRAVSARAPLAARADAEDVAAPVTSP
ncbi:MAG TPA: hypothetical protein VGK92_00420 [Gaiellales bacterium]|jgi:hypothetical protein